MKYDLVLSVGFAEHFDNHELVVRKHAEWAKPGGLVVDYLGLADQLRKALADYTESGGQGKPVFDQEEAVEAMLEKYEVCSGIFHGFDFSKYKSGSPKERTSPRTSWTSS